MTTADRTAADALARHFAFADGGWWEHLNDREQAVYRARALDVVQVVGPIYAEESEHWRKSFDTMSTVARANAGASFPKEPTK